MHIQMELLKRDELEVLKEEMDKNKTQLNNLRRGLFARFDKLVIEMSQLQRNIEKVESQVGSTHDSSEKVVNFPF